MPRLIVIFTIKVHNQDSNLGTKFILLVMSSTSRFYMIYDVLQGTLEMKNEKIIRLLLEMLELDSSEYVRLMVSSLQW